MPLLIRLERKFGRFAVPHLTLALIIGQVVAFLANMTPVAAGGAQLLANLELNPDKVMQGEWWRVITYLFTPPFSPVPIMVFLFWYFFYLVGTTLEIAWGEFRYTVYLLIGYVASVVMTLVAWYFGGAAGEVATNGFLFGSLFLAFARLYPDFQIFIFFILPVKIRWLAILTWISYAVTFVSSPTWLDKALVVSAVLNYLLFFGRDIWRSVRHGHRGMQFQARRLQGRGVHDQPRVMHTCHVCGLTSEESPRMQFRYCSQCGGAFCYCAEHLHNHEHVVAAGNEESGVRGQGTESDRA